MTRPALIAALLLGWLLAFAPLQMVRAEIITQEESQKLTAAKATIAAIEAERDKQADSFNGLLELRDKLDGVRDSIRDVVSVLGERLQAAQAQLAEFGPPPAQGAPAEPPQKAAERTAKQDLVNEIDGHFRSSRALQVQTDQLWDQINDMRRGLFNRRIFLLQDSILSPDFWRRVVMQSLPDFKWRARFKLMDIDRSIEAKQGWPMLYGLGAFLVFVGIGLVLLQRWLNGKQRVIAQREETLGQKNAIVAHALLVLIRFAAPFLITALAIIAAVTRLDIVPTEVQTFLVGVTVALVTFGVGSGAVRAVFSPGDSFYRIIVADDLTARRTVRVLDAMLAVYLIGLTILGIAQMLLAHLTITIAVTALMAVTVVSVGAVLFSREASKAENAPAVGLIRTPMHLLRPIMLLLAGTIIGALLFGYIAFASFLVGRALATALILCIAILLYVTIESVFHDALAPEQPANARISALFGLTSERVDLIGTILAGTLRVLTIVFTVLILLSPWGIEFGNVNPFEDVFFGVRFGDLRGWMGAAGIALVLFAAGLVGTRLFVSWLDNQLLPRTALNVGVRHSITTIAGYIGFVIALTIALGQAGVQLQNIALVASALSVGIGFGLQQVVSNFVAGLIVLAERPIRVGDIISVRGEEGRVRKISVRATELQLGERSTVIVPNSEIVSSIVKNRSFSDSTHRVTLKLTLAHGTDVRAAFAVLLQAAADNPNVLEEPAPKAYVVKVSDGGIEIDFHVICQRIGVMDQVRSELYLEALSTFKAKRIHLAGVPQGDPDAA